MSEPQGTVEVLRRLRRERGQSLRSAAGGLGIDPSQLSRIERGERAVSRDLAERISNYYEVPSDLVALANGQVPDDVLKILLDNPDIIKRLREEYGLT